jgi:pimeloyl-ACP methyl ester carboxylesterase
MVVKDNGMLDQIKTMSIPVNGVELTYVEKGTGAPVIFVHGSLADYRTWLPQIEQFSEKYRAIAYSRRYHYPNRGGGDGRDYTAGLHADDLIGFLQAVSPGPAIIVGTSFGAYTTLVAAIRRPDLMRKLVICEPPILPWLREITDGQAYWDGFMRRTWIPAREAFQKEDLEGGVRLFVEGISGKGTYEQLPDPVRQRMLDNARELMSETLSPGYFTPLSAEQVNGILLPMLLVRGEKSEKMFHVVMDRLEKITRDARQVCVLNANHSIAASNPVGFYQVVAEFLENDEGKNFSLL